MAPAIIMSNSVLQEELKLGVHEFMYFSYQLYQAHTLTGNGRHIKKYILSTHVSAALKCDYYLAPFTRCTSGLCSILLPVSSPNQKHVECQHDSQAETSVDSVEVMEDVVERNELSEGSHWHGEES